MLVIMLGGKARVGKTTLAKLISKYAYEKGLSPMIMPFAAVLKEEIEATTGMTKESNPEEYRKACQVLGSKNRKKDPDYWLNLFAKKIEEQRTIDIEKLEANRFGWHEKLIIVDDCRYLNEVGYGRKINALQIFVSHGKRILEEDTASWRKHESESLANSIESNDKNCQEIFHYRTYNDSTIDKFLAKALILLPEWIEFAKDTKHEGLICSCSSCTARRAGTLLTDSSLAKLIKDIETLKKDWIEEDIDDGTD